MIVVADSGASKTAWLLKNGQKVVLRAVSVGLNPYFLDFSQMVSVVKSVFAEKYLPQISAVYFYGAGCHSAENRGKTEAVLFSVFRKATTILVEDDLCGALRAACGKSEGIACILGTGSGSVYGSGGKVLDAKVGNGVWLGDEGSGAYLGKILIKAYLDAEIPNVLVCELEKKYALGRSQILKNVYQAEKPAAYLASFAPFLHQNATHPYVRTLVEDAFSAFFSKKVLTYPHPESHKIYFVGSIAYHFSDLLLAAARRFNLSVSGILPEPIEQLAAYHTT